MPLFWGFFSYVAGLCALLIAGFVGVQALLAVPAATHPATVETPHHTAGLPPIIKPLAKPEAAARKPTPAPHYAKWAKQKALDEMSSQRHRHATRKVRAPSEEASNAYASGAQSWTRQSWSQPTDIRPY